MSDKCMRCGEDGEDRRTLKMACFYAMEELGLPFEQMPVLHAPVETLTVAKEPVKLNLPGGKSINLGGAEVTCSGTLTPELLYTLRVCKRCRADWMDAIKTWFAKPKKEVSPNSGIFVRDNGTNREITKEEWERRERLRRQDAKEWWLGCP